jgi:quinoprotein glucose dehydrogenase
VAPSAKIAKNFETLILILDDGTTVSGIVKNQDDKTLSLQTPQGNIVTVEKARIDEQAAGQSAMPQDLVKLLNRRELRDLVEYLSTLK